MENEMYIWNSRKRSQKVHIQAPDGRTYCQAENNGATLDAIDIETPKGRIVCKNCLSLEENEPRLSVLMGESL